jgi:hypothetical protein
MRRWLLVVVAATGACMWAWLAVACTSIEPIPLPMPVDGAVNNPTYDSSVADSEVPSK